MVKKLLPSCVMANTPIQAHVPKAVFKARPKAKASAAPAIAPPATPAVAATAVAPADLTQATKTVMAKVALRCANAAETKARDDCEQKKKELADAKQEAEQALQRAMLAQDAVGDAEMEVEKRYNERLRAHANLSRLTAAVMAEQLPRWGFTRRSNSRTIQRQCGPILPKTVPPIRGLPLI